MARGHQAVVGLGLVGRLGGSSLLGGSGGGGSRHLDGGLAHDAGLLGVIFVVIIFTVIIVIVV